MWPGGSGEAREAESTAMAGGKARTNRPPRSGREDVWWGLLGEPGCGLRSHGAPVPCGAAAGHSSTQGGEDRGPVLSNPSRTCGFDRCLCSLWQSLPALDSHGATCGGTACSASSDGICMQGSVPSISREAIRQVATAGVHHRPCLVPTGWHTHLLQGRPRCELPCMLRACGWN